MRQSSRVMGEALEGERSLVSESVEEEDGRAGVDGINPKCSEEKTKVGGRGV